MNQKQQYRYLLLLLLFFAGAVSSCVKSFVPSLENDEELLVVDGQITDAPGPYTVRLSKSSRLKQLAKNDPYTNCRVELEDDRGANVRLTEQKPGIYQTDSLAIQGIPGRAYKLIISTPAGERYESEPEVLLKGVQIQSVYGEVEHKSDPRLFYGRDGYQFYVDTEPTPENNYLLWRMECTYKFKADYTISCYYDKGLHFVYRPDSLRICYRTQNILQTYLLNTHELRQSGIKRFALYFEDNYSKALTFRYSLKAYQLTLSKKAFTYWNAIKKIQDEGGELYAQQPFQVANNLRNRTNPDKPALGYFMAAGISEKRIFITPASFEIKVGKCILDELQYKPFLQFKDNPELWPVFFTGTFDFPLYVDPECLDCRTKGELVPPSFWIE